MSETLDPNKLLGISFAVADVALLSGNSANAPNVVGTSLSDGIYTVDAGAYHGLASANASGSAGGSNSDIPIDRYGDATVDFSSLDLHPNGGVLNDGDPQNLYALVLEGKTPDGTGNSATLNLNGFAFYVVGYSAHALLLQQWDSFNVATGGSSTATGDYQFQSNDPSNYWIFSTSTNYGTNVNGSSSSNNTADLTFSTSDSGAYAFQLPPPCFASGTRIATACGALAVEALRIGDLVRTVSGMVRPIRWLGRRYVDCHRHPDPGAVQPIRIAAGAFGPRLPARDLLVSPDHALYLHDVLIPARVLVNGSTVTQLDRDTVTYHHVELDTHDVLLAEGLPAESYLDTGMRHAFEGGAVLMAHARFTPRGDVAAIWDALGYAPLMLTGDAVDLARATLAARAKRRAARGNAPPEVEQSVAPDWPGLTRCPPDALPA